MNFCITKNIQKIISVLQKICRIIVLQKIISVLQKIKNEFLYYKKIIIVLQKISNFSVILV